MERLTIKELAPYLSYELKMISSDGQIGELIGLIENDSIIKRTVWDSGCREMGIQAGNDIQISRCCLHAENMGTPNKPLLRPLSYLTEEIEHNGERFVPMVELYKIARGRYKDSIVKYWSIMSTTSIMIEQEGYSNFIFSIVNSDSDIRLEYGLNFQLHSTDLFNENPKTVMVQCWNILFDKLHEWHFDTKGLLDRNLALPIDGKEVEGE